MSNSNTIENQASTFDIGGDLTVRRLGYGAMQITGDGIWGSPADPDECKRVLQRLPELGVNFIDTADSYGPYVSEDLIREALHPYGDDMVIATKAGLVRTGPNKWHPVGRPEYLRQECEMSLRRLGVDRIDLYQLHRIDDKVPADEQFGLMKELQDEGKIRHFGLSEVSVDQIESARKVLKVATVQNKYNVADRASEDVLDYCTEHQIGFIPWFPLNTGKLTGTDGPLTNAAGRLSVTPAQVALAWLLHKSPVMLPIPGTSKVDHLEQNMKAASLELADDIMSELDAAAS